MLMAVITSRSSVGTLPVSASLCGCGWVTDSGWLTASSLPASLLAAVGTVSSHMPGWWGSSGVLPEVPGT